MVAARKNGHVDRDHNGKDISYLNYFKHRRRECKEKGIPYNAEEELKWFLNNWEEKK